MRVLGKPIVRTHTVVPRVGGVVISRKVVDTIYDIDESTGEVDKYNYTLVIHERVVVMNTSKFVKLMEGSCAGLASLSATGCRVFFAIAEQLTMEGKNSKEVYMTFKHTASIFEGWGLVLGQTSYYRAVRELIAIDLLDNETSKGYSLGTNPDMIFNGTAAQQHKSSLDRRDALDSADLRIEQAKKEEIANE